MLVDLQGPFSPLAGRLGLLLELHYNNPVLGFAFALAVIVGIVTLGWVTYAGKWGWLWREWLTTVDHKKIGIMYILIGLVMLFRGFFDALMLRTQQAMAVGTNSPGFLGSNHGYLTPFHFDQVYTAHGVILILLAATPILVGLMNIVIPVQIGARDMAYPFLNALGLWMTAVGAALVMIALFVGNFSHDGWVGLTPLTEIASSPGVGVDYWLWTLQITSVGTTLSAINLIATIVKMRAPGMTWGRLPIFSWTTLATNIIALTSFPVLGVALALLTLDRYLGTHFFTPDMGGNVMMYTNLFWIWGHPEVYFVILPAFGILSEIIPTFSEKPIFGYITMVLASFGIAGVSWSVWLHHYFTMGATANVNTFFSVASMLVGIPTGVKVFNWLFTMYRGRLRFETPMLWAVASIVFLLVGGFTGMMVAIPAINYLVHNSVFVVAHFHTMLLMIVYAIFGATVFWWPKVFGFKLDEHWGKAFFWLFTLGTVFVFIPMYTEGLMGLTRRMYYIPYPQFRALLDLQVAGIGFYILSILTFVGQLIVSIVRREELRVTANDAWGTSRSLEWATHTPIPSYNFAIIPIVHARDEWAWRKEHGLTHEPDHYVDIHMPKKTSVPLILGALTLVFGFAMTWRIYWLAAISLIAFIIVLIVRSFDRYQDYVIPAAEIERMECEARTCRVGKNVEIPALVAGGAGGALIAPRQPERECQEDY